MSKAAGDEGAHGSRQAPLERRLAEDDVPRADVVVCGDVPDARRKWRQVGGRKVRAMAKLDESKVVWIARQKAKGKMANREIAEAMGVNVRWVQALWARYRHLRPADIHYPLPLGRPSGVLIFRDCATPLTDYPPCPEATNPAFY